MTHIDPAAPAVDPVELVARTLDAVALDAVANRSVPSASVLRSVAGDLLDELLADERTPPPAVERDADAVRLVDELLVELMADKTLDMSSRTLAERIVDTLLGVPAVTMHYDDGGRIEVDWQDTPSHRPRACIVARDLLDDIVERLQPKPSDPVENHATAEAGQPCPTCGTVFVEWRPEWLPERTAEPGERLPDLPAAAYPPGAVPLPDPELTDGDLLDHLADAIDAAHDARPVADTAPELTAKSHTIVDEEGVMIDVTTGVSAPYVALITTHYGKTSGPVAGLDAAAARRLTQRLTDAIADAPEFDPDDPSTYPCATRRDCGCEGIGRTACPGRDA